MLGALPGATRGRTMDLTDRIGCVLTPEGPRPEIVLLEGKNTFPSVVAQLTDGTVVAGKDAKRDSNREGESGAGAAVLPCSRMAVTG